MTIIDRREHPDDELAAPEEEPADAAHPVPTDEDLAVDQGAQVVDDSGDDEEEGDP